MNLTNVFIFSTDNTNKNRYYNVKKMQDFLYINSKCM